MKKGLTAERSILAGHTLIEVITSLFIASAFSVGLYSIFVEGSKGINREQVLMDARHYATNVLSMIASDIEKAEEIVIQSNMGSSTISLNSDDQDEIRYSVINNLICQNETPIKLPGHDLLSSNQNIYTASIDLDLEENAASFYETEDSGIRSCLYDIFITIDIASKIDENYQESINTYNRVFALNKFGAL